MKNITFFFIYIYSSTVMALGLLPIDWFTLPENQKTTKAHPLLETNFSEVHKTFTSIIDAANKSLQQIQGSDYNWNLGVVGTTIAINSYGLLGLMMLSGTASLRLFWVKSPIPPNTPKPAPAYYELEVQEDTSFEEMQLIIEPVIKIATTRKAIKNVEKLRLEMQNKALEFQKFIQAINSTPSEVPWGIQAMILDIGINSLGMIVPMVFIGGQIGFRFIWKRRPQQKKFHPTTKLSDLSKFFVNITTDINHAINEMPLQFSYEPTAIKLGIGMSASGRLYVAKTGFTTLFQIFFSKGNAVIFPFSEDNIAQDPDMLIAGIGSSNERQFAKSKDISFYTEKSHILNSSKDVAVYKVNRRDFREGLKRAIALAGFFIAKLENRPQKNWLLFLFETAFELSITGTMGFSSLTGNSTCGIQFLKKSSKVTGFKDEIIF